MASKTRAVNWLGHTSVERQDPQAALYESEIP
jgi:hypothetical protein